ncbi:MAG: diversity-generating retroelement protein Avd [Planctomycetota bacterium]|jgi:hypothetical protein|nr:diversity-generating retroelement protein Avd [Planctomycetota bacterium]
MERELKVIQDFYDFILWLLGHIGKFPRDHRFSLGAAMENRLRRILELLLRAKYSRRKAEYLNDANIELEILRFQLRLAKDPRIMPLKSHGHAAGLIQSIGAQIGGWLASKGGAG